MNIINWLVKVYPCRGDYCYFGESVCYYYAWHIIIPTFIILSLGIIFLMIRYRKGGLFGVPMELTP